VNLLAVLMFAMKLSLSVPEWAESSGVALRWHNTTVKGLVKEQLTIHERNRIPKHFIHSAHSRYGYTKRSDKYQRWKNRNRGKDIKTTTYTGSKRRGDYQATYGVGKLAGDANLDLVKTGKTRTEIKQGWRITVGGSGNLIGGKLILRVPIPGGSGCELDFAAKLRLASSPNGRKKLARMSNASAIDTVRRTIKEIETISDDERREIALQVAQGYATALNSRRLRKKK
jgi:hypothetical protein